MAAKGTTKQSLSRSTSSGPKHLVRSGSTVQKQKGKAESRVRATVAKKVVSAGSKSFADQSIDELLASLTTRDYTRDAFDKYDTDHSGTISRAEYEQMIIDQGTPAWLAKEMSQSFFELWDRDDNGTISYEEYKESLASTKHTLERSKNEAVVESLTTKLEQTSIGAQISSGQQVDTRIFHAHEPEHWRKQFNKYDKDHSGSISREEYMEVIKEMGTPEWLAREMTSSFFEKWANNGNTITFEEFALMLRATDNAVRGSQAAVALSSSATVKEHLTEAKATLDRFGDPIQWREMFDSADTDGNGDLSREEYVALLKSQGTPDFLAEDMAKTLFEVWDLDGNQSISYDEFRAMLRATTGATAKK